MTARPKHFFTLNEYFALERAGDARYEYWDGDIFCMVGGSKEHLYISSNIHANLAAQLLDRPCEALTSDAPIKTPSLPPYRYADASVVCGEAIFEKNNGIDLLINPTLIVEVLSPTTEDADRGPKFEAYKTIDSVREYLLVAQDEARITQFVKQENGDWQEREVTGLANTIHLPSINCTLELCAVYRRVL